MLYTKKTDFLLEESGICIECNRQFDEMPVAFQSKATGRNRKHNRLYVQNREF